MKKLLLFVIACTLGLFGTVSAQETSFNYDFNDGSLAGWRLIDHNGDGYNWGASNSTAFGGVDGTYGLYSSCYEGSSLLPKNYIMTENKYLITESSVFSFVHIQSDAMYYHENICVVVSDDINDNPIDFDEVWCKEYDQTYVDWQEVNVSLAEYAGQEVYIGLYHYGSGSNANGIKVDNVKLVAGEDGGEEGGEELASEFSFDFEDGTLTGLRAFAGEGSNAPLWAVTNDSYYSNGTNVIYSASYDDNTWMTYASINNYIVTENAYAITAESKLSWYVRHTNYNAAYADVYEVVVSEDGETFTQIWSGTAETSVQEQELSLAEYAGKNLYIGFRHYCVDEYGGDALVLDNIVLSAGEGGGEEPEPTPVAPAAPTNVVATADGQNSIIVTWNAVEGATYYIVYKDGQMWDQVNGTTYTSTGLTAGTEYCYAVQAYDANDLESELSEEICATTDPAFEIPEGVIWNCSLEFVLGDSYSDGWNGNNLYVSYGDVTEKLTLTSGASTIHVLEIPKGSHVTVTYKPEGGYQNENSFGVRYYGDTEYICAQPLYSISNGQTYTHEFDVNCEPSMPSVPTLTATTTGGSTIVLTIEGAGAESYNIYNGEELFAEGVTGSTYTAENLDPETEYCFTATGVNFLGETQKSAAVCATTMKAGTAIVQIGTGTLSTFMTPVYDYYNSYSISQMIYTEEEIGYGSGKVTSISFYQIQGGNNTRNISVYMKNVDRDYFGDGIAEWEILESDLCVYQGEFTFGTTGWVEIPLQNNFVYEAGSNLMVCVVDNTGAMVQNYASVDFFSAEVIGTEATDARTIFSSDGQVDPLNITVSSYPVKDTDNYIRPIAKFILEPADANVKVKPEAIAFGEVQLGEYWSENGAATIAVTVKPIVTTITSITCDNEFFVLPAEIDYTANPIEFAVAYDHNAAAGEYTGNLTITYGDGATKVVPMTATAYAPATPDVFELAQNITFTENAYTDTPVFANLKDDYNLPKEANAGNNPDAVYSFRLAKESHVDVNVVGENAVYAIYKEDFNGEEGPAANNNVKGWVPLETVNTDVVIGDNGELVTSNMVPTYEYYKSTLSQQIYTAEEINAFEGTINSVAFRQSADISCTRNISVYIVNSDKAEFNGGSDWVSFTAEDLVFDGTVDYPATAGAWLNLEFTTPFEYAGGNVVLCVVDKTGTWASAGVYFDAYATGKNRCNFIYSDDTSYNVDNITEKSGNLFQVNSDVKFNGDFLVESQTAVPTFPAGKYYLVAAAEGEFTVNVNVEKLPTPIADYRLESVATSWGNTAYTYDEENTNTVVSIDEDGLITKVTYNEDDQIASAVATVEEVDEEGNPVETVISGVEYEYDENGVWTSFTETVQGWFGGTVVTETALNYDAEGRLVSLTSEELVRTIAYNEAGLISEVIEGSVVVEEGEEEGEEEEGEEEGDDNGIAPLSETEVEYSGKMTFEYDAEGRLVKKNYYYYDAYETMEFYWAESEVYTYDENGNCVKKESYEVTEENELNSFPYSVAEYIYDLTISNENVYSFEYPHFAFINYVEPSYVNILLKEKSFYSYYDVDAQEVLSHSYEVTAYNYNPAVLSLPEKPMNLSAEVLSAESVELTWAGFADAESFTIYSADTVYAEGLVDPYYTIEGLEISVEYCFEVVAVNTVGTSEVSETVCVTIELPAAPANLVAEATSDTEIALTWDEVPGIWSYNVYQVVEVEGETTYELLGEAWWAEYTVSELTAETEYSFVVKAVNNVGESDASNVATATTLAPQAPEAPVVTATVIVDTVRLTWEAVEGALYYNLYYSGKLLSEKFEETTVDIQVPEVGTYCFTVTAVNEIGESEHSDEVCAEVVLPEGMVIPAVPVLEATLEEDAEGAKVTFSWEAVEGATGYNLYAENAGGQLQYLGTATMEDLPLVFQLNQEGRYCFYLTAQNLAGESDYSEAACVTYGDDSVEENEASFNIYPNPVSDNLVIETEATIEAVTIYTVTGVMVYSEVDFNDNTINVSDFANGVYIMKVRTENGEAVQRFIKK